MKKVLVCSPIHRSNDIRIYYKEIKSIIKQFDVTYIAQDSEIDLEKNINFKGIKKPVSFSDRIKNLIQIYRYSKDNKFDIYHFHNPDTLILAILIKNKYNKVFYDTHEDFSKRILMREWIPAIIRKPVAKIIEYAEKYAAKKLDAVIVTQDDQLKKYKNNTVLIENPPLIDEVVMHKSYLLSKNIVKKNNEFYLIYAGGISKERGITELLEIVGLVNEVLPCKLWLMGKSNTTSYLEELAKNPNWKYVDFKGWVSQEEAFAYMRKSDLGMVVIHDIGDHAQTSPNKLFEYQCFGVPFIASDFPKWRGKVKDINSGCFVNPLKVEETSNLIITLLADLEKRKAMGKEGEKFIKQFYNWNIEEEKLLDLYRK